MTAVARSTDPWTSWAAAESLGDLRPRQAAVAATFDLYPDGLTLEQLVAAYRVAAGAFPYCPMPTQSDSGIRTRCHELELAGIVVDTGTTRQTRAGRRARVLTLATRQLELPL